jgi:hypothetical protein
MRPTLAALVFLAGSAPAPPPNTDVEPAGPLGTWRQVAVERDGVREKPIREWLRFDGSYISFLLQPQWGRYPYAVDVRVEPFRYRQTGRTTPTIWKVEGDLLYMRDDFHDPPRWPTRFETTGDDAASLRIYLRVPGARR